jgi:hypothetical protein
VSTPWYFLADFGWQGLVTDLFAAAARLDARALIDAIPPSVRCGLEASEPPRHDADDVLLELGPWMPRAAARHLAPSLALLTARPYGVRFELSGKRGGGWTAWVGTATLGDAEFAPIAHAADGLETDIDEVRVTPPVEAIQMRVRVGGAGRHAIFEAPWLVTLSAWGGDALAAEAGSSRDAPATDTAPAAVRLAVPPRSQLVEPEAVRLRICSPTSVGMTMEFHGRSVPTIRLAEEVYHAATDRYGLWPAAVRAAASHGLAGYVLRFPDWDAAAWCLARGLPIVASIRYARNELTNSPMPETTGHLVVVTGVDGNEILVNDPAAPFESVSRRYDLAEFTKAWLAGSGIGYVLFPVPETLTARST